MAEVPTRPPSCSATTDRYHRTAPVVRKFALSLAAVIMTLVLLETGVRLFYPQDPGFWDSEPFRRVASTAPHFVENIPGAHTRFLGVQVDINSFGLRDHEFAIPKPGNTVRILAVGDSVTFGYGVRLEDTYPKVLEQLLNQTTHNGAHYEVLNGATLGGSLSDYLHFLQLRAEKIQPDMVVIGFCLNDVALYSESGAVSTSSPRWRDKTAHWMRQFNRFWLLHSQLYLLVYARLKVFLYGSGVLDLNDGFLALEAPSEYQQRAWTSTFGMLTQIARFCREHGYPLVVVVFPMQMQLSAAEEDFYRYKYHIRLGNETLSGVPQMRLKGYAAANALTLVDLRPAYLGYDSKSLYIHNQRVPSDPTHPSALGNRVAAGEILRALTQAGIPQIR
jgi:hypothetical protein